MDTVTYDDTVYMMIDVLDGRALGLVSFFTLLGLFRIRNGSGLEDSLRVLKTHEDALIKFFYRLYHYHPQLL